MSGRKSNPGSQLYIVKKPDSGCFQFGIETVLVVIPASCRIVPFAHKKDSLFAGDARRLLEIEIVVRLRRREKGR